MSLAGTAAARKECLRIDEADRVFEWVAGIEAAFAPGLDLDRGQVSTARFSCALVCDIQVFHAEVNVLRIWTDLPGVAVSQRVVAREDRAAAVEVVSAARYTAAGHAEHSS